MFLSSPVVHSKQTNKQKLGDAVSLFESNHHSTFYIRQLIIMNLEIWMLEAGTAEWKECWTGSAMMPSFNFKLSGPFPSSFARIKTVETSRGPSHSNQLWWCDFLILTFVLGLTDEGTRQTVRTTFLLRLLTRSPHPERLHAGEAPSPSSEICMVEHNLGLCSCKYQGRENDLVTQPISGETFSIKWVDISWGSGSQIGPPNLNLTGRGRG